MKTYEITKEYLAQVLAADLRKKFVGQPDHDGKIIVDVEVDIYTGSWADEDGGGEYDDISVYIVKETPKRKIKTREKVYL